MIVGLVLLEWLFGDRTLVLDLLQKGWSVFWSLPQKYRLVLVKRAWPRRKFPGNHPGRAGVTVNRTEQRGTGQAFLSMLG